MSLRPLRRLVPLALVACALACGPAQDEEFADAADEGALTSASVQPVNDGAVAAEMVRLIGTAKASLDLIVYEYVFDDAAVRPINAALQAAVARHVKVRVLLDAGVSDSVASLPKLQAIGVDAKLGTATVKAHNKVLLVDRAAFLAGSSNLSSTSLTKNHETNVEVRLASAGRALAVYFDKVWATPDQQVIAPPSGSAVVHVLGDGQYAQVARALIDGARRQVQLVMYSARYAPSRSSNVRNDLVDALAAAARRGVRVQVILERGPNQQVSSENANVAAHLAGTGVEVRFDPPTVTTHAKLLVVDDVAIAGSSNWTSAALSDYHATDIEVIRASVATAFRTYFSDVWKTSTP